MSPEPAGRSADRTTRPADGEQPGELEVHRVAPAAAELRAALYRGEVFQLPPSKATLALVTTAEQTLERELGPSPRQAHRALPDEAFFAAVGRVRRALFCEPESQQQAIACAAPLADAALTELAIDPARIRVIVPGSHRNPRAAPIYVHHRDTWYAHPEAVITAWIPLHDMTPSETFRLFPEALTRVVANDSEVFNYGDWVRDGDQLKVGWQAREAGRTVRYPGLIGPPPEDPGVGFAARRGELLLFAGAHFHRTHPREGRLTRFSLDFRVVHLGDHAAGLGAPNVDNRSRGSAVVDYVRARP